MSCPRDNTALQRYNTQQDALGVCRTCRGMWIPHAVLESYARNLKLMFSEEKLDEKLAALAVSDGLACPDGHGPMVAFDYQGVEIDICPHCHGVWLDHGELATIQRLKHGQNLHQDKVDRDAAALDAVGDACELPGLANDIATRMAGEDPGLPGEMLDADAGGDFLEALGEAGSEGVELVIHAIAFVFEALSG